MSGRERRWLCHVHGNSLATSGAGDCGGAGVTTVRPDAGACEGHGRPAGAVHCSGKLTYLFIYFFSCNLLHYFFGQWVSFGITQTDDVKVSDINEINATDDDD